MDAKICDRCGKVSKLDGKKYNFGINTIVVSTNTDEYSPVMFPKKDLCDDCMAGLIEYLKPIENVTDK